MGRLWTIASTLLLLSACERPLSMDASTLTIQVPEQMAFTKANSLPSHRKACFGINVLGPGIPFVQPNTCSPTSGVLAGFVEAGQIIQASVPKGSDRRIELLVFLQKPGQNIPCPKLNSSFSSQEIINTYLIASKDGVNMMTNETNVELTVNFPGEGLHLGQQLSMPPSCHTVSAPTNSYQFQVTAAKGKASGAGIRLYGKVGATIENKVLEGPGVRLYVQE